MRQSGDLLPSRCPICGQGELVERPWKPFMRSRRRVLVCSACRATFAPLGAGWFRLTYCAPHLLGRQGCRRCLGRLHNMCLVGRALARPDWERMAHRQPPAGLEEFRERSRVFALGELPVIEAPSLASELEEGEVVHHVAYPVFVGDGHLPGARADDGRLFVTNRRLLYCARGICSAFPFADIDELEQEYPGFRIRFRGEHFPHRFFPPPLDPAFAATAGALKRFRTADNM